MKQMCVYILSFSAGFLSLTLCKPREYILVKQLKTWTDAQVYCRENHLDLATVQSAEDQKLLQQTADESVFSSVAWIGLYNDINSWRWSYQDENIAFLRWYGQPDNYGSGEECAVLRNDGYWLDRYCTDAKHFLCYNEHNSTVKYVLIKQPKMWSDAQMYCREHHTDLVTIRNQTENDELTKIMYWSAEVWIGLFRDDWKWSDQANLSSSNQLTIRHLNGGNENCATSNYYGYIEDWLCATTFYFYCNTVKLKKQMVRVQVKSSDNVDETRFQTLVLNKLQQMLIDQGLTEDDVRVTWRKQPNGKVFQKKINIRKSANGSSVCFDKFC